MGEERVPTGFELMRENARMMLERTSPSEPTTQAMADVAESVNSMDLATRDLLGKLARKLEDLANQASASSTEQSTALAGFAKKAGDEFGKVYAASGGVTGEDIEELSQNLAETVAAGVPAGVEKEAEAVRDLAAEFASTIMEASDHLEATTRVVEEAADVSVGAAVGRPPGPREALEEVGVGARERREERAVEYERQKKQFTSLGGMIVGGFGKVMGAFFPDLLGKIGFVVGGLYAVKDELLMGFKLGWDVLNDTYRETKAWWEENWQHVPGFLLDLAKDVGVWVGKEIKWLWKQMPIIKRWLRDLITDPVEAVLRLIPGYKTAEEREEARVGRGGREEYRRRLVEHVEALPSGASPEIYARAKKLGLGHPEALAFAGLAERDPGAAAAGLGRLEALGPPGTLAAVEETTGVRRKTELVREAFRFAREREALPTEAPVEGVSVAAEQALQRRTATTGVEPSLGMFEIARTIARDFQILLRREDARKGEGAGAPFMFDNTGPPDSQGLTGAAAGVVLGGMQ